jgi:hypothetical protein
MNTDLEIADIFNEYGHLLGGLSKDQKKVVNAIQNCRTSAMGGHKLQCNSCDHQKYTYNSCRNRHCPKCGFLARTRWIEKRGDELIDCSYFHVVFTLPCELRELIRANRSLCYDLLFKASSQTLKTVAKDKKHLGADIGCIGVLHTWAQNLRDHPHVHYLVPGGGLRNNKWIKANDDYLLNIEVLSIVFRGKVLEFIEKLFDEGKFILTGDLEYLSHFANFKELLNSCAQKNFIVYCKKPFAGPKQVLEYLGQYTHRIAISNFRLVKIEDNKVFFKVRDKKNPGQSKLTSLYVIEFMKRFLQHVLPRGFVRIRHFGILGNRYKKVKIELIRKILGSIVSISKPINDWKTLLKKIDIDVDQCPKCLEGIMSQCNLVSAFYNTT